MFESHNKYTKLSYCILAISSLIGFVFMGLFLPSLAGDQPILVYGIASLLSCMLILNTYFAYRIYKHSYKALKLCLWLYGLQIIGFETENWAFSLNFGVNLSFTLTYNTVNITINFAAILIWLVVFKAIKSLNKANNPLKSDGEKAAAP